MNQNRPDATANSTIRDAIRTIALKGVVNKSTGAFRGAERTSGYVVKVHKDGELAGTIDVQEFITSPEGEAEDKLGYHEGVLLSAIQDNSKGYVIIPKLYSEVMIACDPVTMNEYVVLYSHVDEIRLDSYETISVGVTEREELDIDNDESPDIDELPETGVKSNTTYTKNSIVTEVQDQNSANHAKQIVDGTQITQVVGDNKSSISLTHDDIVATHKDGRLKITDSESTISQGNSEVKVEDGTVYVGSHSQTDDAVLGVALADVMDELLSALQSVMTTTMMGPQPFMNLPQFATLKAKIAAYKSSHSGFLTRKVQIQK